MPQHTFQQAMRLNKSSFDECWFDAAYHFLAGALHVAYGHRSELELIEIETTAIEQLAYIDTNHPEYHHSTKSAAERNTISIFAALARQASTKQAIIGYKMRHEAVAYVEPTADSENTIL